MSMDGMTGADLWRLREELEKSAASILGQLLLEFARLDTAAGMCVSWVDEGRQLEVMTKRAMGLNFHGRVQFLAEWVDKHLPAGSKQHTGYAVWIRSAHRLRKKRNELVHGRWWVDPGWGHVVNVVGLPNSPEQTEHRYTLEDLQAVLDETVLLQNLMYDLRKKWPL